jgi:hypothetical protein
VTCADAYIAGFPIPPRFNLRRVRGRSIGEVFDRWQLRIDSAWKYAEPTLGQKSREFGLLGYHSLTLFVLRKPKFDHAVKRHSG